MLIIPSSSGQFWLTPLVPGQLIGIDCANDWCLLFPRKALCCQVPAESYFIPYVALSWPSSYDWASAWFHLSFALLWVTRCLWKGRSQNHDLFLTTCLDSFHFPPPCLPHSLCSSNIKYYLVHRCTMLLHIAMPNAYCFICLHLPSWTKPEFTFMSLTIIYELLALLFSI